LLNEDAGGVVEFEAGVGEDSFYSQIAQGGSEGTEDDVFVDVPIDDEAANHDAVTAADFYAGRDVK
jgi:hypothetical protein